MSNIHWYNADNVQLKSCKKLYKDMIKGEYQGEDIRENMQIYIIMIEESIKDYQ